MVHLSAHACRPAASAREHNRHGRLGLSAGDRALHDAGQAFDQLMADDGAQRSRCDPIAPIRLRPFRNAALPQVKRRRARTCFQVNPPRYLGMGVEVPDQIDQVAVPWAQMRGISAARRPWIGSPESLLPCRFRRGCPEHVVFSAEEADAPVGGAGDFHQLHAVAMAVAVIWVLVYEADLVHEILVSGRFGWRAAPTPRRRRPGPRESTLGAKFALPIPRRLARAGQPRRV